MRKFILTIFIFSACSFSAQVGSDVILVDLGHINKGDDRIKEITLTNNNSFEETIVRIGGDKNEFDIKFSARTFFPGEKIIIRLKYNPRTKGIKNYDIPIYFGKAEPISIELKAMVNYLEWEDYTPCPDFSTEERDNNYSVIFKVVNSRTGEPIKNASIAIAQQSMQQAIWKTNKKGEVEKEIPLGYYAMLARADGFDRSRKEGYINRRERYFIFALDPNEEEVKELLVSEDKITEKVEEEVIIEIMENEEDEESVETTFVALPNDIVIEEANPNFSLNEYVKNNVVFLIDVSTSMKKEDRLEILKESMIELLRMLRPEDRLSIITYSSSTDVVMNSRPVDDKNAIEKIITELQGKGLTAGGTGIKKAYSMAQKNFIEKGNNQVYLATDGAFNKGENDVSRFVKKQKKKGIYMSIIAVRSSKWTISKMKDICKQSNGNYISIDDFEMDKEKLKELIKLQSQKSIQ